MNARAILLLLRLRALAARRSLRENPAALVGTAIATFVFGPASVAAAAGMRRTLDDLPPDRIAGFLALTLLAVQGVWLLLHLLPGGLATIGRSVPTALLKTLPVRPSEAITAAGLGSLFDLPLLFAFPVLFVAVRWAAGSGMGPAGATVASVLVALFLLQTAALGQLVEQAGALLARRKRSYTWAVLAACLGFGIYFGLPPALASSLEPPAPAFTPALSPAPREAANDSGSAFTAATALPAGFAASGLRAAAAGEVLPVLLDCALLLLSVAATLAAAAQILRIAWTREATGGGGLLRTRTARTGAFIAAGATQATPWGQVRAVAAHEWRSLTRNPGAHLTLRSPASLLLTVAVAWMAPDLGADALRNMWDLVGMGAILYAVLWQVQLLCNRFGNDAGTGTLLLGLPVPRARLIAGRNLALGALLLLLDIPVATGLCLVAQKPHLIPVFVGWLPPILLALTAFGNVVSVVSAFPIPKRGTRFSREPERSLMFVYVALGFAVWAAAVAPVSALLSTGRAMAGGEGIVAALVPAALWLIAFYAACLHLSARLLGAREPEIIRRLDRS